ncbi:hypothetical protein BD779DRAFT_1469983 [Infundibulicybe gibba]|nr:hypothetical protein BD779DRAFT_1469983 [Infundibulicybe gibba]
MNCIPEGLALDRYPKMNEERTVMFLEGKQTTNSTHLNPYLSQLYLTSSDTTTTWEWFVNGWNTGCMGCTQSAGSCRILVQEQSTKYDPARKAAAYAGLDDFISPWRSGLEDRTGRVVMMWMAQEGILGIGSPGLFLMPTGFTRRNMSNNGAIEAPGTAFRSNPLTRQETVAIVILMVPSREGAIGKRGNGAEQGVDMGMVHGRDGEPYGSSLLSDLQKKQPHDYHPYGPKLQLYVSAKPRRRACTSAGPKSLHMGTVRYIPRKVAVNNEGRRSTAGIPRFWICLGTSTHCVAPVGHIACRAVLDFDAQIRCDGRLCFLSWDLNGLAVDRPPRSWSSAGSANRGRLVVQCSPAPDYGVSVLWVKGPVPPYLQLNSYLMDRSTLVRGAGKTLLSNDYVGASCLVQCDATMIFWTEGGFLASQWARDTGSFSLAKETHFIEIKRVSVG